MRRLAILTACLALLAVLACPTLAAEPPLVQKMLPPEGALKGFAILPGSLVYGKGDDLTKIYDGAVDLYKQKGTVDAARQIYSRKDDLIEITIHTMKSNKAALDFLKYWQKEFKAKQLTKTKYAVSFTVADPSPMTYLVVGKYFATIIAYYPAATALKELPGFSSVVVNRIRTLAKPG